MAIKMPRANRYFLPRDVAKNGRREWVLFLKTIIPSRKAIEIYFGRKRK